MFAPKFVGCVALEGDETESALFGFVGRLKGTTMIIKKM
jgi:hypothetical protein